MSSPGLSPECSISDVSEQFGLSLRAIRLYEERGLLKPRRDSRNRRRYGSDVRARLAMIGRLRQAGIGLEEIRALLSAGGTLGAQRTELLQVALAARVDRLERALAAARAMLTALSGE
jgi:DNA-binding transcriptional MerR regulator